MMNELIVNEIAVVIFILGVILLLVGFAGSVDHQDPGREFIKPRTCRLFMMVGAISMILSMLVIKEEAWPKREHFFEEKLFDHQAHRYLIVIKASSPEALEEGIKKRGPDWQVTGRYEVINQKDDWSHQAHLLSSPSP